jgi:hypothetical protein
MDVVEVEGLPKAFAVTAKGAAPVLLLPSWSQGPVREYMFAWLVAEVYRRAFGERAVACQVGRAVREVGAPRREAS